MTTFIRLLIAAFALSAAGAQARGINCGAATTMLERTICADAEMLDYDRRIAAAYSAASSIWNGAIASYVQRDQREWLTAFRTIETLESVLDGDCVITDKDCIRAELRRRVDDIESGAYVHSGAYRTATGMKLLLLPGRANGYRVRVYDPRRANRANVITADGDRAALWDGPQFMVSTMGDSNGLPLPAEDGCTLRLLPGPLSIQVFQKGACQGHSFEGVYNRLLDETLRGYELELH